MSDSHQELLDEVAVYALGSLDAGRAQHVREHLRTCAQCRAEYEALTPAVTALGTSATADATPVSPLLKARIMREVRTEAATARRAPAGSRPIVWPAYLVAAACFLIAIMSSIINLSLMEQLKSTQAQVAQAQAHTADLALKLSQERTTTSDLLAADAKRYDVANGQVVRIHDRIYLTMHDMPAPPRGKVYQAWTLAKGAKTVAPSVTFVPDAHGVAIVALPIDATTTQAVAVSVEPQGGSKTPTTKPLIVEQLD